MPEKFPNFSVEEDGIYRETKVPGYGNTWRREFLMSKECFIEAFNKYIKGEDHERSE